MDLDDFDIPNDVSSCGSVSIGQPDDLRGALELLDNEWYFRASRSSRWMDLLGDYAGVEPFVLDGEALFQEVLDDPLLAIGRETESSFQMLHAYYTLESILDKFSQRSANVDIVFWHEARHLTLRTGDSPWTFSSRSLARAMLFEHLRQLNFKVYCFDSLVDPQWKEYRFRRKPMFVMTNDGGAIEIEDNLNDNHQIARILIQRMFFMQCLFESLPVALLRGAEFRGIKIVTFLHESRHGTPAMRKRLLQLPKQEALILLEAAVSTTNSPRLDLGSNENTRSAESSFFEEMDFCLWIDQGFPAEIVYLFVAHVVFLPYLSVADRAQAHLETSPKLQNIVTSFLTSVFLKAVDSCRRHSPLQIDGTIFTKLVAFVLSQPTTTLNDILGEGVYLEVERIWQAQCRLPLNFVSLCRTLEFIDQAQTGLSDVHTSGSGCVQRSLLPFSNPIFDPLLVSVQVSAGPEALETSKFDNNVAFRDSRHWHSQRALLPKHLGGNNSAPVVLQKDRARKLRMHQRFMAMLQIQAATLTGVSGTVLRQISIASTQSTNSEQTKSKPMHAHTKSGRKPKLLSKKEQILADIQKKKDTEQRDDASRWWVEQMRELSRSSPSLRRSKIEAISRNPKAQSRTVAVGLQVFSLHTELQEWVNDLQRDSADCRDRYSVSIIRIVKDICARNSVLTSSTKKALCSVLKALGFDQYTSMVQAISEDEDFSLGFPFIDLFEKTGVRRHSFMQIQEHPITWQLRLFGDYMDRSMDSAPDVRVSFQPDAWQRKVLDGIDANKSLLVVAPTSAGKTFISFYAMEKILRQSNKDILIYVAPTKALVNQIAAEVYARFNKSIDGKSFWAIHTREYRIHDPLECQILITVPEVLAIMLLSPEYAKVWTPRVKRIILDEIHTIGQDDGGAVWEQIILFSPCPIIGLSATIGSPKDFSDWLASVQRTHGFDYEFVEHAHRYSHLRKFYYAIDGNASFTNLESHKVTNRSKFLHPIGLLAFGPRILPTDLSLEASDTLTLSKALISEGKATNLDLSALEPTEYFASFSTFLRQMDVLRYEASLKTEILNLMTSSDPRDISTTLGSVVNVLQGKDLAQSDQVQINRKDFLHDLPVLLSDLHVAGNLPAVLFSFDRSHCEIMAQSIVQVLENQEARWRNDHPDWKAMNRWQTELQKAKERSRKAQSRRKGPASDEDDVAFQMPFTDPTFTDPSEPSPAFSFADPSRYSKSELENDIQILKLKGGPDWTINALKRGIAVHHAGMHKHYRGLIEGLFRKGFIRVIFATGTLALGINAPTKTTVFCGDSPYLTALMYRQCSGRAGRRGFDVRGNVIFYGIPLDRVQRLVLSKLPSIGGTFPLTCTLALRLFSVLSGSDNSEAAINAVKSVITMPQMTTNTATGRNQVLHHLRFSIEYLRRSKLIDGEGHPISLYSLAGRLYYTEPSNLALVALMRAGVFHAICSQEDEEKAKRDVMIIMCNLFGRRNLARVFSDAKYIKNLQSKYPSQIILPPLPESARLLLADHDSEILQIFTSYALAYVEDKRNGLTDDCILPLSHLQFNGLNTPGLDSSFLRRLRGQAIRPKIRSAFVATSGHSDRFVTVTEFVHSSRSEIHLSGDSIPSMSRYTTTPRTNSASNLDQVLNAYLLDFYTHGQAQTLTSANGIRKGDLWYVLQDFDLILASVKAALEQFSTEISKSTAATSPECFNCVDRKPCEPEPKESWEDESDGGSDETYLTEETQGTSATISSSQSRDGEIDNARVYDIVGKVAEEFHNKFVEMWA